MINNESDNELFFYQFNLHEDCRHHHHHFKCETRDMNEYAYENDDYYTTCV